MIPENHNGNAMTLQRLVDDLRVVVRDGEELLRSGAGQLQQKARAGARAADASIRRNPYPGMGLAFGLGFLLGVLARNAFSNARTTRRMNANIKNVDPLGT
ncbi:MAG: hypothetical protein JWR69_847 [Pedosphaera sp.]|nr:hypothetical protein [Pedosphaera sp.]